MTLIEKRQKLAALVKDARVKLDAGDLEAYNKMDAGIDKLDAEIKAEEKQQAREDALKKIPEPAKGKAEPQGQRKTQKNHCNRRVQKSVFQCGAWRDELPDRRRPENP
jgi:hypothetical protein